MVSQWMETVFSNVSWLMRSVFSFKTVNWKDAFSRDKALLYPSDIDLFVAEWKSGGRSRNRYSPTVKSEANRTWSSWPFSYHRYAKARLYSASRRTPINGLIFSKFAYMNESHSSSSARLSSFGTAAAGPGEVGVGAELNGDMLMDLCRCTL